MFQRKKNHSGEDGVQGLKKNNKKPERCQLHTGVPRTSLLVGHRKDPGITVFSGHPTYECSSLCPYQVTFALSFPFPDISTWEMSKGSRQDRHGEGSFQWGGAEAVSRVISQLSFPLTDRKYSHRIKQCICILRVMCSFCFSEDPHFLLFVNTFTYVDFFPGTWNERFSPLAFSQQGELNPFKLDWL